MSDYFQRSPIFNKTLDTQDIRRAFKAALLKKEAIPFIGVTQPIEAIMLEKQSIELDKKLGLYLSGAGLSTSLGLPDIGVLTLDDVVHAVRMITRVTNLPLFVDIDTGYGDVAKTIEAVELAGASGVHIEDQLFPKRCGHLDGKELVSLREMIVKIRMATSARKDENFVIMARSDAKAVEGMNAMIDRLDTYVEAGADALFPEALTTVEDFSRISTLFSVPLLANLTENGKTPLGLEKTLRQLEYAMLLYPVTLLRSHMKFTLGAINKILHEGNIKLQDNVINRTQAMKYLNYDKYVNQDEKLGNHGHEI